MAAVTVTVKEVLNHKNPLKVGSNDSKSWSWTNKGPHPSIIRTERRHYSQVNQKKKTNLHKTNRYRLWALVRWKKQTFRKPFRRYLWPQWAVQCPTLISWIHLWYLETLTNAMTTCSSYSGVPKDDLVIIV